MNMIFTVNKFYFSNIKHSCIGIMFLKTNLHFFLFISFYFFINLCNDDSYLLSFFFYSIYLLDFFLDFY